MKFFFNFEFSLHSQTLKKLEYPIIKVNFAHGNILYRNII